MGDKLRQMCRTALKGIVKVYEKIDPDVEWILIGHKRGSNSGQLTKQASHKKSMLNRFVHRALIDYVDEFKATCDERRALRVEKARDDLAKSVEKILKKRMKKGLKGDPNDDGRRRKGRQKGTDEGV